jgi:carboxyl-terminal processing protease
VVTTSAPHQVNGHVPVKRGRRVPWTVVGVVVALVVVAGAAFGSGFVVGRTQAEQAAQSQPPADIGTGFNVFWEAWNLVRQHYVDQSAVDPTRMTYGAIQGMLDALGDVGHSRFLSPAERHAEEDSLAGRLDGIGAEVVMRDRRPTILAPLPGSPAEAAGLRPGDTIVRVDGKDVQGLPVDQVTQLVRGPSGTPVTLSVLHQGETEIVDISVIRQQITVPSVTWAIVPGTTVAHVLISEFADHSGDQLVQALQAAQAAGATGIVLDLRNDPGGLRDEAINAASQFLSDGTVLIEQDAHGARTFYPVKSGGVALNTPLVGLINEGTASSAEIVAGAIQDHRRATLVGTTTFGTGTVLSTYPLSDGSALLLGTEEWLTPNGNEIWHHGVAPEVQVDLSPQVIPLEPQVESRLTADQVQSSQDSQLLRALQLLAS